MLGDSTTLSQLTLQFAILNIQHVSALEGHYRVSVIITILETIICKHKICSY